MPPKYSIHPLVGLFRPVFLLFAGAASAQTVIPASFAHPLNQADITAPGFVVRSAQASSPNTLDTTLVRTEAQLAGLLINPATSSPFENIADLALFDPDGTYAEELVIDYDQNGASSSNLFFPGIPGTEGGTDSFAVEVVAWLPLQPGTFTMVVNSDDGFRVTAGPDPRNKLQSIELGSYDGGRGSDDSSFQITVTTAGLYGFRLIYNEGGSDAKLSWYLGNPADPAARVLINDELDATAIPAWRKLTTPTGIYADVVVPAPGSLDAASNPELQYRLVDSASAVLNPASLELFLDNTKVNPTVSKTAGRTSVNYNSVGILPSGSVHTVKLVYADSAVPPVTTATEYAFTVSTYSNIIVPGTPVISENFDSWAEQILPPANYPALSWTYHDWTVEQHSNFGNAVWDLDDPNSDSFQGWVVLSKARIASIGDPTGLDRWDGDRRLNVAEQFVNGVKVSTLITGNFFYSESDQRGGSQVQYLFSPDFNLSGTVTPWLYFHSIYEQNQDNVGSVEYSINQGVTWLPVLYMIHEEDIILDGEGKTDAETTLSNGQADTATYFDEETGESIGGTYGAFIGAAPETWSTLAPYISGRVNDDPVESKRVEFHAIPQAAGQSKVRFRFAQAGTASWYFGIDNFAVYDLAAPAGPLPELSVEYTGGKVILSWPASATGFNLETSPTLTSNSWTAVPGATLAGDKMTVQITPSLPKAFYRLRK